ncbi:MAG: FtsQ-type POTRA domain-containing protein [Bacteroidetes bacterium]|nr:FtsQ-type POTRA domain-containing protein [Bacteroidota bacterium]
MRRKKSVKPTRYRSVGIATFFVLAGIAGLAVLAAQWRHSVVGVDLAISGLRLTTEEQIQDAAGVTDTSTLAELDLLEIRHAILQNPFVRDVDVSRDPPRILRIAVTERTPIAMLLNVQTRDWLLDEDGYVLPAEHLATVHDLPVLTGAEVAQVLEPGVRIVDAGVQKALQVLKYAARMDKRPLQLFSEINLSQSRDLVLYTLDGGVPVIFGPHLRIEEKLRAFGTFWENVAMKYDPASLEYIDLRWKEQVVTRWRSSADAPEAREDTVAETALAALPDTLNGNE